MSSVKHYCGDIIKNAVELDRAHDRMNPTDINHNLNELKDALNKVRAILSNEGYSS